MTYWFLTYTTGFTNPCDMSYSVKCHSGKSGNKTGFDEGLNAHSAWQYMRRLVFFHITSVLLGFHAEASALLLLEYPLYPCIGCPPRIFVYLTKGLFHARAGFSPQVFIQSFRQYFKYRSTGRYFETLALQSYITLHYRATLHSYITELHYITLQSTGAQAVHSLQSSVLA